MNPAPKKHQIIHCKKIFPANCCAVDNELTFGKKSERKVEGEIIHVASACIIIEKIIIPADEGQKRAQCLYLKMTAHTHTYRERVSVSEVFFRNPLMTILMMNLPFFAPLNV